MDLSTHSPISSRGCYHYSTMAYVIRRPTFAPYMRAFNFHSPNHPDILRVSGHPLSNDDGAGRGTRTPKGFQAPTLFKSASSSSRITCIYGVGGGIRTLGRHDNRRRLSRALVSTTHPPLHNLRSR